VYMPPLIWQTKFHTHIKQQAKLNIHTRESQMNTLKCDKNSEHSSIVL
jgi:hypothetical protein